MNCHYYKIFNYNLNLNIFSRYISTFKGQVVPDQIFNNHIIKQKALQRIAFQIKILNISLQCKDLHHKKINSYKGV